jgi:hypothetical protein
MTYTVNEDGTVSSFPDDGSSQASAGTSSSTSAGSSSKKTLPKSRLLAAASLKKSAELPTSKLLFAKVVAGTANNAELTSDAVPGTSNAPLTNANAVIDPLVAVLGVKKLAALLITAIIIVGSFLLAVVVFIPLYLWRNRQVFNSIKAHFAALPLAMPDLGGALVGKQLSFFKSSAPPPLAAPRPSSSSVAPAPAAEEPMLPSAGGAAAEAAPGGAAAPSQ